MEATEMEFLEGTLNPSLRRQLVGKWGKLVEGISDRRTQENTAMLLENEMSHMKHVLQEAMSTSNVAEYTKFVFPLIRNVWPNLLANNIVSVVNRCKSYVCGNLVFVQCQLLVKEDPIH